MAYREASGWLTHIHLWIHPHDLALRDHALTDSYGVAFRAGRLNAEIPLTVVSRSDFETSPSNICMQQALQLARHRRRLAELRTWRPLANSRAVQATLQAFGYHGILSDADIDDWFATIQREQRPPLIRAGRAARDWMNRVGLNPPNPTCIFFAACLWREKNCSPIPLPFWSAPEVYHHKLDLHFGLQWIADFLECVAAATHIGLAELAPGRGKERAISRTKRSRLKDAMTAAIGAPIITTGDLADMLHITPQAALGLLRQLSEAGVIREATGRASWRAFSLA